MLVWVWSGGCVNMNTRTSSTPRAPRLLRWARRFWLTRSSPAPRPGCDPSGPPACELCEVKLYHPTINQPTNVVPVHTNNAPCARGGWLRRTPGSPGGSAGRGRGGPARTVGRRVLVWRSVSPSVIHQSSTSQSVSQSIKSSHTTPTQYLEAEL